MQCRLFGKNITRSKSPYFHNELAKHLNIDLNYQLNSIDSGDIDEFKSQAKQLFSNTITSSNVTYPFKEIAIEVADKLDISAQRIGAANTLIKRDGKIIAYNTDYSGFKKAYEKTRSEKPGKVVLIGCGGVGKAIAIALVDLGVEELTLFDMDENKSGQLASQIAKENVNVSTSNQSNLESNIKSATGLVNCTPVGHYATPGIPVKAEWISTQSWVFDAVYTPIDTEFLLCAKSKNIETISGFELFFNQAIDGFCLFTGTKPSEEQLQQFRESHFSQLTSYKQTHLQITR